jgi:hypothetical protein
MSRAADAAADPFARRPLLAADGFATYTPMRDFAARGANLP